MQTLTTYRKANRISQQRLAEMVGTDQSIISRIENGMTPTLVLAAEIERVTGGNVPAVSWVQHISPSSAPSSEAAIADGSLPSNKRCDDPAKLQGGGIPDLTGATS